MAVVVYVLCVATALACSVLLLRGYQRSRAKLLLWSGLCFALLAAENLSLFVDQIVFPTVDLSFFQIPAALAGVVCLLFGLIWSAK
ncbi:MAG: hypothetical protein OHK0022_08360 [Roseiflexaceae bacterium]